jgi:tetratricopeptide (TPR) repeat protein
MVFIAFPAFSQVTTKPLYHQITFDAEAGVGYKESLVREMAERFEFYNQQFGFNPPAMVVSPLMVRVFVDRGEYDDYVNTRLGRAQNGAVYLHPRRVFSRELVINRGSAEEKTEMPRQAFFQFLCAFIPNPPSWIKEGFAVYYSRVLYNESSLTLDYQENMTWLSTVKGIGLNAVSLETVLLADSQGMPGNFQALAWSLVSFFANAGQAYADILKEIIQSLSSTAEAAQNSEIAMQIIRRRIGTEGLLRAYNTYFASLKTFNDLVADGQKAYTSKDYVNTDLIFLRALDMQPTHYMPYYYLGLAAFETSVHDLADHYFRIALEYGADPAMIYYSLGLNANASGQVSSAISYLEQAAQLDPELYQPRTTALLTRLRQQLR